MRPNSISYAPAALDRNGIGASQTPAGAGALTLDGVLASGGAVTLSYQQYITVWSASNIAARVFTVTGTDQFGAAITATITGINNSTVATTKAFKTVSSITVDAGTGAAVEAGVNGLGYSIPYVVNFNAPEFELGIGVALVSGAGTYSVQYTYDNPFSSSFSQHSATWYDHATIDDKTASFAGTQSLPVTAVRLIITVNTDASLTMTTIQS